MDSVTLDKLPIDTLGRVLRINCDEGIKRRLLDLGIIRGTIIKPVLKSPFRRLTCI